MNRMFARRRKIALNRLLVFTAIALLAAASGGNVWAQVSGEVAGRRIVLPTVPVQPPRDTDPDQAWMPDGGPAQPSVSSFAEALKGNDAAVEITVGQGRLLTLKKPLAAKDASAFVAAGDPTVIDFEVLPNARMIRVTGKRPGLTDLSITNGDGETYSFEVHVVYDIALISAYLKQTFPDARLTLSQLREHIMVQGQARSATQVSEIIQTLELYLASALTPSTVKAKQNGDDPEPLPPPDNEGGEGEGEEGGGEWHAGGDANGSPEVSATYAVPKIINLIRVPGVQQVMLQVKIAELNRTGLREIGADLGFAGGNGNVFGTSIGGAVVSAFGLLGGGVAGGASAANGPSTTAFGVFPDADFQIFLRALRDNSLLRILAEPNLVAMSGHQASFLAGGQFPVPVPQISGGVANSITVQFRDFGVQLDFLPYVLDDDVIRLTVAPEVSSIDFSLGTTLVVGGDPIPGLNTRRADTTVEMRQGQTLAIAGLLQVEVDGNTSRIPGLGDLPYIGPLFSNTSHERKEKELLVLVTPYLVSPMQCEDVPALPGQDILDPHDVEFYFHNRIEGRTGMPYRSTTSWDDVQVNLLHLEENFVSGPSGFSECE
ncbi:MAG: pilus assembly protein N-terminal domain-containing protein [Planctomycetales bacterium]|nr:pilus assembly protein N-terminal domain-containing protein [Planctomycetales bacterium]